MIDYDFDDEIKSCFVCDDHNIAFKLKDHKGIKIDNCSNCGFQFMNPQYSDKYLAEYYSTYTASVPDKDWADALNYRDDFYFSLIEKHSKVGRFLDVGCGSGSLLKAAINRGWDGCGYEIDKNLALTTSKNLGVDVAYGDFGSTALGKDYDLITMHQVLEHLKDPNQYLSIINSRIKRGGYLFVAVPNIKSFANSLKYFLEKIGLRRKNIAKYYDTSHHILYFQKKTLSSLLERHGFQVVYQRNCHSVKSKQTVFKRFLMRNFTDYLFSKSAFFVIAKKVR